MTPEKYNEIIEARRRYQREYHRRWRAANKDKVKASNDKYYAKLAERYKAGAGPAIVEGGDTCTK